MLDAAIRYQRCARRVKLISRICLFDKLLINFEILAFIIVSFTFLIFLLFICATMPFHSFVARCDAARL